MEVKYTTDGKSRHETIMNGGTTRVRDDAIKLEDLKRLYEERGNVIAGLMESPLLDLATCAMLIEQAPNSDALDELRGHILLACDDIKALRAILEVKA